VHIFTYSILAIVIVTGLKLRTVEKKINDDSGCGSFSIRIYCGPNSALFEMLLNSTRPTHLPGLIVTIDIFYEDGGAR